MNNVHNGHLLWILLSLEALLFANQSPHLVQVDGRAEFVVAVQVEVTHTDLAKVTGMVFVKVDAVVVHATSVTAATGMLTVFAWKRIASVITSKFTQFLKKTTYQHDRVHD